MKPMFPVLGALALGMLASPLSAKPIAFAKGTTAMFEYDAGTMSEAQLWHARNLPCPADPNLARSCTRLRQISWWLWNIALLCTTVGALFAFVFPRLT